MDGLLMMGRLGRGGRGARRQLTYLVELCGLPCPCTYSTLAVPSTILRAKAKAEARTSFPFRTPPFIHAALARARAPSSPVLHPAQVSRCRTLSAGLPPRRFRGRGGRVARCRALCSKTAVRCRTLCDVRGSRCSIRDVPGNGWACAVTGQAHGLWADGREVREPGDEWQEGKMGEADRPLADQMGWGR